MTRAEIMAYFDLVNLDSVQAKTAGILGYKKIFGRKEMEVREEPSQAGSCIVRNAEPGVLGRSLRRNNVVGIIIKDNELLRMVVEETVENEKLLILPIHEITCADTRTRQRNLYRMRGLMAFALRSRAKVALATLAEEESCFLSSSQLIEVAKFLGASEAQAKEMAGNLGEIS